MSLLTIDLMESDCFNISGDQVQTCICVHMYTYTYTCVCSVVQSHVTVCNSMDCSCWTLLSMGILQARILEQLAITSSRGFSQHRDRTQVSHIAGAFYTISAPGKPIHTFIHTCIDLCTYPPVPTQTHMYKENYTKNTVSF